MSAISKAKARDRTQAGLQRLSRTLGTGAVHGNRDQAAALPLPCPQRVMREGGILQPVLLGKWRGCRSGRPAAVTMPLRLDAAALREGAWRWRRASAAPPLGMVGRA
jgi:hypothetical protein